MFAIVCKQTRHFQTVVSVRSQSEVENRTPAIESSLWVSLRGVFGLPARSDCSSLILCRSCICCRRRGEDSTLTSLGVARACSHFSSVGKLSPLLEALPTEFEHSAIGHGLTCPTCSPQPVEPLPWPAAPRTASPVPAARPSIRCAPSPTPTPACSWWNARPRRP